MVALPALLPNLEYWKSQIKCQAACPVNTDARGYVRAIAEGDDERAYLIARGPNPLASICGRVCGAPCESACRRGDVDRPVSIRALKRYVCERFGSEAAAAGGPSRVDFLREAAKRHAPHAGRGREELLPLLRATQSGEVPLAEGQTVGVIGSGPAGLAAAHDLALLGFEVTIYEMEPVLAGMLALGIPEYRLPRDVIRAEVDVIRALGVHAVTNCQIGRDVSLAELRERHDAVVVAVGAKRSRGLPIPGADATGVLGGVEFLRDVALDSAPHLGREIVVIGGGNVAFDVGRSVIRQTSIDAARTALRAAEGSRVHLCSLESLDEMPADDVEIIEGDEEGIHRHNGLGPVEITTDGEGNVTGVVFRKCLRVFGDDGRFSPVYDDADRTTIPCDTVLLAIGQSADLSFIDPERDGLELDERGLLPCDPESGRTSAEDVFLAGDLAYGPKLLIHAVASGKQVAREIYRTLTGREIRFQDVELHLALPDYRREPGYERAGRVPLGSLDPSERVHSHDAQVEFGYSENDARREASRCLDCGVNTIFDGTRCILCGGCVDVCPSECLRIVSTARVESSGSVGSLLDQLLGRKSRNEASAILKDETICIRCALCAERCPTGAITMERFSFEEIPTCPID